MLRKAISVLAMIVAGSAASETIQFDLATGSMTLPAVAVGSYTYKLVLHYDSDGRLSITSATPVSTTPSSGTCSLDFQDTTGAMQLTIAKVLRVDPVAQYLSVASPTLVSAAQLVPRAYLKLIGKATSGTPFFCGVVATQSGRQIDTQVFNFRADFYGADAGYESCGTFQPNTQTVLYIDIDALKKSVAFLDINAPINLTVTPPGSAAVTKTCSF